MSIKKMNHLLFALLILCIMAISMSEYISSTSSILLELIMYIPTLALMMLIVILLILQKKQLAAGGNEQTPKNLGYYYIQVLENIPASIVILNELREVIYHNKSAHNIFGINKNQVYTDDVIKNASPFTAEYFIKMENTLKSGQGWFGEQTIYINGEEKTFLHQVNPIVDNNILIGTTIYSLDISELVKTRKDAEAADIVKNQFLANISHELRTPLIGILGSVELLEQSAIHKNEPENIRIIRDCGEQLLEIINKIIDVSKIELGLVDCNTVKCNLSKLIEVTVNMVYPALQAKSLTLSLEIDSRLPHYVIIDQAKLQQILLNILYNAVKFTNKGGITFKLDYTNINTSSWITISITDTGPGIPKNHLSSIFSPFTQVDNSSSRQFEGTGLGLYISKELASLMNGELWIESEENIGSTFYVKLPLDEYIDNSSQTPEYRAEPPNIPNQLLLGFTPINILVVEDNDLTQKIVCQILHNYGFQSASAANGLESLEMLQANHYDMILMDMQMPLMDGYETTRLIRSTSKVSNIPIIAMTAYSTIESRQKCLDCGCNSYISKPFKAEELINEINNRIKPSSGGLSSNLTNDIISELMPEFLESLNESICSLDSAVKNENIQEVKSISHDIKGSAGLYGFHEISRTAADIEQAAQKNEPAVISNYFFHLMDLYKNINTRVS